MPAWGHCVQWGLEKLKMQSNVGNSTQNIPEMISQGDQKGILMGGIRLVSFQQISSFLTVGLVMSLEIMFPGDQRGG